MNIEEKYYDILKDAFEVSVPNGWLKLVDECLGKLVKLDKTIKVCQIKEKFGSVRIYWSVSTKSLDNERLYNRIKETVDGYEAASYDVCEICGTYGTLCSKGGWLKTLCEEHRLQMGYKDYS
jgi:hypothetical protein